MTTLRAIFTAFAPEYLERYPTLPTAHRQVISAIQQCHSGHDGHSLSPCQDCGGHHRVHHACGNRHCPQWQQQKTQPWFQHHLDTQLPGFSDAGPDPLRQVEEAGFWLETYRAGVKADPLRMFQVVDRLDHTYVNDMIENPTAEVMAVWIWNALRDSMPGLAEVTLWETRSCAVVYRGE
jgi:hypothetical protein